LRTADACDALARVLAPYLGETMARSAVAAHCTRAGVAGETVGPAELDLLVTKLGAGLNIFVGRKRAAVVADDLRRAVGL
jgi:hypothetical protein